MGKNSGSSLKKHTRTLKETLIIYGVGTVICIYLGFLCGAVWMPENDLWEFIANFNDFIILKHHFLVGVTKATPIFIGVFWVMFSMIFIIIATKFEHPFAGQEYGVAKWGNAKDFTRQFANHDPDNEIEVVTGDAGISEKLTVNCKNYWLAEGVYLSIDNVKTSNLNMLVVGPPGSGKSFRLARPMLSQLCGNFLVTDPKGELYKQTGQYFEDNGYEVMVMNVESEEGMPMSIHFNPFRYIRNESDIMSIAGILMKATTPQDESGGGNDQFFEQSAEVLLTSLIYIMKEYIIEEERNWATFVKLLNATTVYTKADGSIDNRPGGILDIAKKAQLKWKKSHDSDFPGYVAIEKYYNGAAETTSSIVASLDAHCRYMKLQCVIDLLSEDEIKISESFGYSEKSDNSKTGKRILFIVTSEDKRYYDWIPSMVYSLFFDELYHLTAIDPKLHETLPHHLTFLMDEFANVTLPDSFVEKLSTMRSRNMSAVIIVQNLIQLKRKFPKFDMDKDLIGNCLGILEKEYPVNPIISSSRMLHFWRDNGTWQHIGSESVTEEHHMDSFSERDLLGIEECFYRYNGHLVLTQGARYRSVFGEIKEPSKEVLLKSLYFVPNPVSVEFLSKEEALSTGHFENRYGETILYQVVIKDVSDRELWLNYPFEKLPEKKQHSMKELMDVLGVKLKDQTVPEKIVGWLSQKPRNIYREYRIEENN